MKNKSGRFQRRLFLATKLHEGAQSYLQHPPPRIKYGAGFNPLPSREGITSRPFAFFAAHSLPTFVCSVAHSLSSLKFLYIHLWMILFFLVCFPVKFSLCDEKPVSKALLSVQKDIEKETENLISLRKNIADERGPLVSKMQSLEKEVLRLRKKNRLLRAVEYKKEEDFIRLKNEVDYMDQESDFVFTLLQEYRRDTERRMTAAEAQLFEADFKEADAFLEKEDRIDSLASVLPLLKIAYQRNRQNIGGRVFPGNCLDSSGILKKGYFVLAGPVSYFVSEDEKTAGLSGISIRSASPRIEKEIAPKLIKNIIEKRQAVLPFDVTLGNAQKTASIKKSWLQHIRSGGIIMVPILGLGVICIIIAVWKMVSLSHLKIMVDEDLDNIIALVHRGEIEKAKEKTVLMGHPIGPVLLEGIYHCKDLREYIEDVMHEKVLSEIPFLEKGLSVLAVAAAAAPLLGLLGTVTGMIHTFDLITLFGTGKASLLSSGISVALVTTEYGLIIAVPALITHAFLARRVKFIIHSLDKASISFINGIKVKKKS